MPNQDIIHYIKTSRNVNISDTEIIATLLKTHHKEEEIDEAFKHLDSNEPTQPAASLITKFTSIGRGIWDYIMIIIIGVIFLAASILIISHGPGNKKLDEQRMDDFLSIKNEIQYFYQDENRLPRSLIELQRYTDQSSFGIKDPQTKKQYDYIPTALSSYKLCTAWSTVNQKDTDTFHPKGYYCLNYSVDNFNGPQIATPTIYPLPTKEVIPEVTNENPLPVTIYNPNTQNLTDYQILVDLNQSNFAFDYDRDKVSVSDPNNNKLSYWIEEWDTDSNEAKIWVKIPKIKTKETKTIYIDLNGNDLTSGENTFDFFDDFTGANGSSPDTTKWIVTQGGGGIVDIQNNMARLYTPRDSSETGDGYIDSINKITLPSIIEFSAQWPDYGYDDGMAGIAGHGIWYGTPGHLTIGDYLCCSGDASGWTTWTGYSTNKLYKFRWTITPNVIKTEELVNGNSDTRTIANSITKLHFGDHSPHSDHTTYIDDVRVRKYASPEPVVTVVESNDSIAPTPTPLPSPDDDGILF